MRNHILVSGTSIYRNEAADIFVEEYPRVATCTEKWEVNDRGFHHLKTTYHEAKEIVIAEIINDLADDGWWRIIAQAPRFIHSLRSGLVAIDAFKTNTRRQFFVQNSEKVADALAALDVGGKLPFFAGSPGERLRQIMKLRSAPEIIVKKRKKLRCKRLIWDSTQIKEVAEAYRTYKSFISSGLRPFICNNDKWYPISNFIPSAEEVVFREATETRCHHYSHQFLPLQQILEQLRASSPSLMQM